MTEIEVHKEMDISEERHEMKVVSVEAREVPKYDAVYQDFTCELLDVEGAPKLKVGFNSYVSASSQLGRFLTKLGLDIEGAAGGTINLDEAVGKPFNAVVRKDTNEHGTFHNIDKQSIQPSL